MQCFKADLKNRDPAGKAKSLFIFRLELIAVPILRTADVQ